MANRGKLITQDHLYCPVCKQDYSKTNLVNRFERIGNTHQLHFICDCKRNLMIRCMVNGWFKIYDVTEIYKRRNLADRERRKRMKNGIKAK